MARILPETLPGRVTKETALVYRKLKKMNDPDLICRLSYPLGEVRSPEFLVLYQERYAFLLAVSDADTESMEERVQGDLFADKSMSHSQDLKEWKTMEVFLETLQAENEPDLAVEKWLLFPKASAESVRRVAALLDCPGYRLLGREECQTEALEKAFRATASDSLDSILLGHLRSRFSPESTIPRRWVSQVREESESRPFQTDFFLDYDQEAALKKDLELSAEAREVVDGGKLRLVTGVAGCGKTLVLLFRARALARLRKNARILVLTHNKPLRGDLENRIRELDDRLTIEWNTFYRWIRRIYRGKVELLSRYKQIELLRRLLQERTIPWKFSPEFLVDEFAWICDHAEDTVSESWYQRVERVGRHRGLGKAQRNEVFALFREYRKILGERGQNDWAGFPVSVLHQIRQGKVKLPSYDAIYVDEAQFFAPVWFTLIKEALEPEKGELFMVADPTQGFLRSGLSWQQVLGREVRGRAQRLEKPYRNTRDILTFAGRFYQSRLPLEDGEVNLPDEATLQGMPAGEPPRFLQSPTAQDEKARLVAEIARAREEGLLLGQVLVIHSQQKEVEGLVRHLSENEATPAIDAKEDFARDKIRVCSLNACTGLEAPVVVVLGLDHLFSAEESLALDEEEREELRRSHTKKVFVALTRATHRLLILHRSPQTQRILKAKNP
ncbi:MAG: AAA family ATPase [Opitutales bacterium]|nr:AAA family ATPase [Opitutales bacterium]